MKRGVVVLFCGLLIRISDVGVASWLSLPSMDEAKALLNSTHHHPDWVQVPAGSKTVLASVTYPDRADKAAVLIVTAPDQKLSDRLRAIADQMADEGFIAVVPDALSSAKAEVDAVRDYMIKDPAANGRHATVIVSSNDLRIDVAALNKRTGNDPSNVMHMPRHAHAGHAMFEPEPARPARLAQPAQPLQQRGEQACAIGSLTCKRDDLVAGASTAKSTLARSPIRAEWVDIPVGTARLHTRITYPQGGGKAPIVIVMTGAGGLNDWMRSAADQLAREGFIGVAPDIHSGFGPNGGNWDSFEGLQDEAIKANARISRDEVMRRYKAARDYALKLPQANGKSASIGFCAGGGNSFAFAGEVPDLNAAVVFYGVAPNEATMAKINAPVLGLYGQIDARIVETVEPTAAAMKKLAKTYEPHIYKDATHAFLEYQNLGANGEATAAAWPRAMTFLKEHTK
jgi:carboxymethylenebutenolidase